MWFDQDVSALTRFDESGSMTKVGMKKPDNTPNSQFSSRGGGGKRRREREEKEKDGETIGTEETALGEE